MKTLLFTLEYPLSHQASYGGVANYYENIAKYWPKSDNIIVLHNNDNKLIKDWLRPKWLPAVWQLWQVVKKQGIEHILVGHILPLGTVAYFVTKFTKTPYSVILHGMDFTYALRTSRKRKISKKILSKAQHIICASNYTAGLVKKFIGDENISKVAVVNPGIEPHITQNIKRITQLKSKYHLQDKIILLSIGRLVKRKGFDKVIAAMPEVLKQVPNLVYLIAGVGPDENYLKKKVPSGYLHLPIIFLGKISEEEKWAWLNLSDIFIMPARSISPKAFRGLGSLTQTTATVGEDFEGFGIVYLEANLCGKPVIAGDSGGIRDAVVNTETGLLVDPNNTDKIANAIIKLAKDQNLREKLGKQGRERVVKKFLWKKQVRKIYELLN